MEQWTHAEKEQVLSPKDTERLEKLHDSIRRSSWRTEYHIQTVTGLLNDPNGFSYFDGKWHLFYQWFPYGAVHGMKHWYHVTSEDLIHWQNKGLTLKPDLKYDNHGCYSGSAFPKGDYLYMVYTGNHREPDGKRIPYQMIAAMDGNGAVTKLKHPIITPQEGYTEHQRDPKIFMVGDTYYILLGAQDEKKKGRLLLYKSDQIAIGWEFAGELKVRGYEDGFGYMCECPDLEKIGDKWVLLFSPQGLERKEDSLRNAYPNVYFIGDLDLEDLEFRPDGEMQELDCGFDFYAAQCAMQKEIPDTAILAGWVGGSDCSYPPSDEEGWSGLISIPRLLTIEDGKLIQRPAASIETLKGDVLFQAENGNVIRQSLFGRTPASCIMHLENPEGENIHLGLFATYRSDGFAIDYNASSKRFSIDRSGLENQFNTQYGDERHVTLNSGLQSLDIYVDHSVIEIYVNHGEKVLTSRVFPTDEEHLIRMSGNGINLTIWKAERAVQDDFVLFRREEEK